MRLRAFFINSLLITHLNAMQPKNAEEAATLKILQQKYSLRIKSTLRETTQTYLNRHPKSVEAQIIDRYTEQFLEFATFEGIADLTDDQIDWNLKMHSFQIPATPKKLEYVLTGKKIPEDGRIYATDARLSEWQNELKKIEDQIEAHPRNHQKRCCAIQ